MAKRKQASAKEAAEPLVTDDQLSKPDPKVHLVYLDGDPLVAVLHEQPRQFLISVEGVAYCHVAETPEGVWIYRRA